MSRSKKRPSEIRSLLFDLGKVILDFNFEPAYLRMSAKTGLSAERIRDFFRHSELEVLYDGGKLSSFEFYRQTRRRLGHRLSYAEFRRLWNGIFTPKPLMIRLIRRLRRHYRLVLISNTNAMHYAHLFRTYPVLRLFDRRILSFRLKIRKPDERIYRAAIRACRARPEEIFYIDDRGELTEAAHALGLRVFTFKNNWHELTARMRELRIL